MPVPMGPLAPTAAPPPRPSRRRFLQIGAADRNGGKAGCRPQHLVEDQARPLRDLV